MTDIPSGSVIITPDDMWKAIQETRDIARGTQVAVAEIKLIVDPALNNIRDDVRTLDDREAAHHEHHGKQIQELQQASWSSRWVPALIASLLFSVGASVLFYVIQRTLPR